jgi:uncharacterized membrane protein YkvI
VLHLKARPVRKEVVQQAFVSGGLKLWVIVLMMAVQLYQVKYNHVVMPEVPIFHVTNIFDDVRPV